MSRVQVLYHCLFTTCSLLRRHRSEACHHVNQMTFFLSNWRLLSKCRLDQNILVRNKFTPFYWANLSLCVCLWRYLGEVMCVNMDSVHIVCSTNCVHCTVTNSVESQHSQVSSAVYLPSSDGPSQTEYSFVSDEPSQTEYSSISDEPYTSEKLSRLRSGFTFLSVPSVVVKFNFNNRQVCNLLLMLCDLRTVSPLTLLPWIPLVVVVYIGLVLALLRRSKVLCWAAVNLLDFFCSVINNMSDELRRVRKCTMLMDVTFSLLCHWTTGRTSNP